MSQDTAFHKHHRTVDVPAGDRSAYVYVEREVARQDEIHPPGFPATRDGLRLGLAAMQDELDETLTAWRTDRRVISVCPWLLHTEEELLQTVAIGIRMLRTIHELAGATRIVS